MAGFHKDDTKGDDRWIIRLPDAQPEQTPEQRERSAKHPEMDAEALAAFLGQFQTPDELDEYLKSFPRLHQADDTETTT